MAINKGIVGIGDAGGVVPNENFNTVLYTGNGGTQAITNVGFEPNLTWIKQRNGTGRNILTDSVRGVTKYLFSELTNAEVIYGSNIGLTSFDSDGFTVKDPTGTNYSVNGSGFTYVAWSWKAGGAEVTNDQGSRDTQVSANTDAGFSIVTLDKPNTNTDTYGHGLSEAPELIILKRTASADDWYVYSKELGNTVRISLNSSAAKVTGTGVWGSTTPTNSVFTLQNQLGGAHVAYCFHSVDGFSKIGSYVGNGSTTGPTIVTGFRPAWIMFKPTTATGYWYILDNKRSTTNPRNEGLFPNANLSEIENTSYNVDFNSDGFQLKNNTIGFNQSGQTYIFMAFAE